MLTFSVLGQQLVRTDTSVIAGDSVNYITAGFTFSDDWDGLVKTALFKRGNTTYEVILTGDAITKSNGVNLTGGTWEIGVTGLNVSGEMLVQRITTNKVKIDVDQAISEGGESFASITPTIAEQIIAMVSAMSGSYGYIKYSVNMPTQDSDVLDEPSDDEPVTNYIGVYMGISDTAPVDYTEYTWFKWKGTDGKSISGIQKTGTEGLVDTYTITFTDETTETFTVRNGADGEGSPSDSNPAMNGTAAPGNADTYSRSDHVHPSDTAKAALAILAPEYSTESTYALGVFCTYSGKMYECTTPIAVPEAWTAGHWTERTVGYVLAALNTEIALKVSTADIINDLTHTDTNKPLSAAQGKALQDGKATTAQGALADTAVQPETIAMLTPGGVFSGGVVIAQGTPDQTVDVSAVSYITDEGKRFSLSAVDNLAADAADGSNPRIDIVYGSGAGAITYLAGTAAGSPTQPATPAHGVLLAAIARAATDNTIATGDITDQRIPLGSQQWETVEESSDTFAFDLESKAEKYFEILIADTDGKTFTFANRPKGACTVAIRIRATATAATKTWTLDGGTVAWVGAAPALTAGYTYLVVADWDVRGQRWINAVDAGAAN